MRSLLLTLAFLFALPSQAAFYWLSPTGNDGAAGTEAAPWLTWDHALQQLAAGDTLLVKDGTFTPSACNINDPSPCVVQNLPQINCDGSVPSWTQAVDGTAEARITIKAENERQVLLRNVGTTSSLTMYSCDYWTVEGFRFDGGDFDIANVSSNFTANDTNNLILRRNLSRFNNRYQNTHLYQFANIDTMLIEENEGYHFHRHGMSINSSHNVQVRRNYMHSRSHADLAPPGTGYDSHDEATDRGDECGTFYFTDNSIMENNVAESCEGYSTSGWNNTFLGNMANDVVWGITFVSNCQDPPASQECDAEGDRHANNNVLNHQLVVNANMQGILCKTCGGRFEHVTVIGDYEGTMDYGFNVRDQVTVPGYTTSAWLKYWHVENAGTRAYEYINDVAIQHYGGDYMNEWNGGISPWLPDTVNWKNKYSVDPNLRGCYVYPPVDSPLRLPDGNVMGAEIVYEYQNGRLTDRPLWDRGTKQFSGCGAVIEGVNDTLNDSCIGAHIRLGVEPCALP